jgi:hypothetical protein
MFACGTATRMEIGTVRTVAQWSKPCARRPFRGAPTLPKSFKILNNRPGLVRAESEAENKPDRPLTQLEADFRYNSRLAMIEIASVLVIASVCVIVAWTWCAKRHYRSSPAEGLNLCFAGCIE